MMNNSTGSPPDSRRNAGIFLTGRGRVFFAGAEGLLIFCALNQCSPTATPWAQIFPHSRASRQLQRFSMSTELWMTSEPRKVIPSACTTPRSNGGAQYELVT